LLLLLLDHAGVREEVEFQAGVEPFCQFAAVFDWPMAVGTFQAGVKPELLGFQAGVREEEVDGFHAGVRDEEVEGFHPGVLAAAEFQAGVRDEEDAPPEFQAGVLEEEEAEFQAGVFALLSGNC
jgi:hypothetical protein